jgi:hypothetical protein
MHSKTPLQFMAQANARQTSAKGRSEGTFAGSQLSWAGDGNADVVRDDAENLKQQHTAPE